MINATMLLGNNILGCNHGDAETIQVGSVVHKQER